CLDPIRINLVRMQYKKIILALLLFITAVSACKKNNDGGDDPLTNYSFSYSDSVIYPNGGDLRISPVTPMEGTYTAFPEGIELNESTGEIDVSESETGLRYRITFTPKNSTKIYTTTILLAGINYLDAFYFLSKNDTLSKAVYNGDVNRAVPVSSGKTVFDIDLGCNKEGIAVNIADGTINLAKTIRNGFFGRHPDNDSRKEFEMEYKIDDKSKQAKQELKIKLYYYETMADVPQKYFDLLKDREGTILRSNGTPGDELISGVAGITGTAGNARPRPPCIFIIGR
ncbi:MAG: hypothetical protein WCF67_20705, partial [Chitinophagaceae bacterium]